MDYEKAWNELHRYIDKGISHYKQEYTFGKDKRFDVYLGIRMKMQDLEIRGGRDAKAKNKNNAKASNTK